jgi:dephospho-CoA kinase
MSRIKAQMPLSDKLAYADHVLDNSGTEVDLQMQVDSLVAKWRKKSAGLHQKLYWLLPPLGIWAACMTVAFRWLRFKRKSGDKRRGRGENATKDAVPNARSDIELHSRDP